MIKKVFIGVCEEITKKTILEGILSFQPKTEIIDGTEDSDLFFHLKSAEEAVVLFDKYFLSYILKYKLKSLNVLNPKLRIYFCELGNCSRFFGLRLHDIGVNGFISNIENEELFKKKLNYVFEGITCYPEEVLDSLKANEHLLERKSCSEITEKEMEIGLYLGQGKTIKEISEITNNASGTVGTHICRLKRKIGFKTMNDFKILNNQLIKINVRSWSC